MEAEKLELFLPVEQVHESVLKQAQSDLRHEVMDADYWCEQELEACMQVFFHFLYTKQSIN